MRRGIKTAINFCRPDMTSPVKELILDAINDEFSNEQLYALETLLQNPFSYNECDAAFGDLYPLFEYGLVTLARFAGSGSVVKTWVVVTTKGDDFYQSIRNYLPPRDRHIA